MTQEQEPILADLARTFRAGDRVRARLAIYYAMAPELEIAERAEGRVVRVPMFGLCEVSWDQDPLHQALATSTQSLDQVDA